MVNPGVENSFKSDEKGVANACGNGEVQCGNEIMCINADK